MSDPIVTAAYPEPEGTRQDRGLILAATKLISRNRSGWVVPSQSIDGAQYVVDGSPVPAMTMQRGARSVSTSGPR